MSDTKSQSEYDTQEPQSQVKNTSMQVNSYFCNLSLVVYNFQFTLLIYHYIVNSWQVENV